MYQSRLINNDNNYEYIFFMHQYTLLRSSFNFFLLATDIDGEGGKYFNTLEWSYINYFD